MDYCYSCRRNLNGALVCPGCGAYAPDIAPPSYRFQSPAVAHPATMAPEIAPATMNPMASGPEPWGLYGGEQFPDAGAYSSAPGFDTDPAFGSGSGYESAFDAVPMGDAMAEDTAAGEMAADAEGADADAAYAVPAIARRGSGRADRRRQMERWKKNKRRAVAATVVAIAGGALTAATLPNNSSKGQSNTASAPEGGTPVSTLTSTSTDSATVQPDADASQHKAAHPSTTTAPKQHTTVSVHPAATSSPQPNNTATYPLVQSSPAPHPAATAPTSGNGNTVQQATGSTQAPAPATTTQAPAPSSPSTPTTTNPAPPASTSPTQVCLLFLCLN